MATDPDALAAELARINDSNEADIKRLALTDATVATMPSGDLRKALAALRAVLGNHAPLSEGGPTAGAWCPTCWRIAPCETVKAITRELLSERKGNA